MKTVLRSELERTSVLLAHEFESSHRVEYDIGGLIQSGRDEPSVGVEDERMLARGHDEPAGIEWGRGHGANRYTFVRTEDGGRWMAQTDQLRDGSYFGVQYHLRLYGAATPIRH